jgi:hypothetical protein
MHIFFVRKRKGGLAGLAPFPKMGWLYGRGQPYVSCIHIKIRLIS